jgi:hypothetical protein
VLEILQEMPVKEFGAVVAVEAAQREGQGLFNARDGIKDTSLTFAPDGTLFGPTGGNIDNIDGINEQTGGGGATVGYSVCLDKPRDVFIPLVGLDRNMLLEEGAWLGGCQTPFGIPSTEGCEQAVNGCRRDLPEQHVGVVGELVGRVWKPQRDHGVKPFAAHEIAGNPEALEKLKQVTIVVLLWPSRFAFGLTTRGSRCGIQDTDGILPVIATGMAELVQDATLESLGPVQVTTTDRGNIFAS